MAAFEVTVYCIRSFIQRGLVLSSLCTVQCQTLHHLCGAGAQRRVASDACRNQVHAALHSVKSAGHCCQSGRARRRGTAATAASQGGHGGEGQP